MACCLFGALIWTNDDLNPLYTGAATFGPPLCNHKTGKLADEGTREAELPWSFKGGTQDVHTLPWMPSHIAMVVEWMHCGWPMVTQ